MSRRVRLLLIVLALMTISITSAFATPPPPPPSSPPPPIGPFNTLAECNDSLKNSTVPHSGCYQCNWNPDRFCYNVYPAGSSTPTDPEP